MYLNEYPELKVKYKFNSKDYQEDFAITLTSTDNSTDVEDFDDRGYLYRQTISCEVRDARLLFIEEASIIESIPIHYFSLPEGYFLEDDIVRGDKDGKN